jgi:hypothetical protein
MSFMEDRESPYQPRPPLPRGPSTKADSFFRVHPNSAYERRLVLRPKDAARILGISTSTLNRLARTGEIKCIRLDHMTLYPMDTLEAWVRFKLECQQMEGGGDAAR